MKKNFLFSAALALTLIGGAVATATLPAAAPVAASQAVAAMPLTAAPMAPSAAVSLTTAEMSVVRGAGIFSFVKDLFKTIKKAIAGAIVSFFTNLFKSWIEQIFGVADGGEKQNQTQTVTQNYNSQADYDAGIVASTSTEETTWVTTETWSGSGCGGDSGGLREGGLYFQQQELQPSC
jgi:hypothetical protein